MQRPDWGIRRALMAVAALTGVVFALCAIRYGQADDPSFSPEVGPAVAPLARTAPDPNKSLDYFGAAQKLAANEPAPKTEAQQTSADTATPPAKNSAGQDATNSTEPARSKPVIKLPTLKFPFSSFNKGATDASSSAVTSAPVSSTASASTVVLPQTPAPATFPASSGPGSARPIYGLGVPLSNDPYTGAPSNNTLSGDFTGTENGIGPAPAPLARPTHWMNPWGAMQTAYRQMTDSRPGFGSPAPAAEVVPQPASSQPQASAQPVVTSLPPQKTEMPASDATAARIAYIRSDNVQPTLLPTTSSTPTIYPTTSVVVDGAPPSAPGDVTYGGPSGCGCNGGGRSPDGSDTCPNCGGWQPGTCSTHNPNGSCLLQRLSCCLCKPYPDCSNGCVDFCHSWIFHEDDCWLFSNHKCCNPDCGPYPYGTCATDGQGKGSGCGCGNCGPCVPPPDLYFTVGAIAFSPEINARNQTLVNSGPPGGAVGPAESTSDLGFDWRAGPSFLLGYRPTPMDAWELSYFGINDWSDQVTPQGSSFSLPGNLGLTIGEADAAAVSYSSRIDNAELNYLWHHDCPNLMWLAGFRYFHLGERLDITSTVTGTGSSLYDVRSENDLFGGQLGARLRYCCTHFEGDITAKAGAYDNSVGQQQYVDDLGVSIRDAGHHSAVWAFVGDIGLNGSYYICKNWCAMAGYNVMWVDGLALAPNQLDFTDNLNSGGGLNHQGSVFYQGAHVGIGCHW
jgi:Putative beta barrel porin-7 (BBP7)